ncbi:MAG TPA: ABC transporter substrate-binding protein, partial [Ilumatobacteraceae bacterium]
MRTSATSRRPGRILLAIGATAGLVLGACSSSSKSNSTAAPPATAAPTTTAASLTTAPSTAATTVVTTGATTGGTTAATTGATTAPTTGGTTGGTAAAPTKSPLLISALVDVTGPSTGDGSFTPDVIKAWVKYINGKGGINGHPVTIDIEDTAGDAAKAQSETTSELAKKPVMWLLDSASTEAAQADALKATNIPVLGVGYSPAIWGGKIAEFNLSCSDAAGSTLPCAIPNAFPVTTTFGAIIGEQVYGAVELGSKNIATAACAEVDSCSQADPVFTAAAKAAGIAYSGLIKVSSSAADYTAECIKFVQDKVDYVQISASGTVGAKMWSDCADQGYTGAFGASAGSVAGDLITTKGITLAGGLNAFPWFVDD